MKRKFVIILALFLFVTSVGWTQERLLKKYTTYKTTLTNDDIMKTFVGEVRNYLQRYDSYGCYYFVGYEVYQEKEKQNYAWTIESYENKYQWGTGYTIKLFISNAMLCIQFCNTSFSSGGQDARKIITTRPETVGGGQIREHIINTASSMINESRMVLKMYNDSYSQKSTEAFAFNIIELYFW